jgi:hypothetical protein
MYSYCIFMLYFTWKNFHFATFLQECDMPYTNRYRFLVSQPQLFCRISLYANEANLMINLILVVVLIVPKPYYRISWNLKSPINLRMECTRAQYRIVWCWILYQSTFSLTEDNYKLHKSITVKKEQKLLTEAHGLVVINRYMLKIVI